MAPPPHSPIIMTCQWVDGIHTVPSPCPSKANTIAPRRQTLLIIYSNSWQHTPPPLPTRGSVIPSSARGAVANMLGGINTTLVRRSSDTQCIPRSSGGAGRDGTRRNRTNYQIPIDRDRRVEWRRHTLVLAHVGETSGWHLTTDTLPNKRALKKTSAFPGWNSGRVDERRPTVCQTYWGHYTKKKGVKEKKKRGDTLPHRWLDWISSATLAVRFSEHHFPLPPPS